MTHTTLLLFLFLAPTSWSQVIEEKAPEMTVQGARFENLTQGGRYTPGGKYLSWRRQERSDPQSSWHESANLYSTRYQVISVASRAGGSELFLAGVFENGTSIIERWSFAQRTGRWRHTYTGPPAVMGTPSGPYTGSQSIVGGAYAPPPSTWYAPDISLVLETDALGTIRSIEADPEGRFLIFNTFPSGNVYQIDLAVSPATPVLRFTSNEVPSLANGSTLQLSHNSSFGRTCISATAPSGARESFGATAVESYVPDRRQQRRTLREFDDRRSRRTLREPVPPRGGVAVERAVARRHLIG